MQSATETSLISIMISGGLSGYRPENIGLKH